MMHLKKDLSKGCNSKSTTQKYQVAQVSLVSDCLWSRFVGLFSWVPMRPLCLRGKVAKRYEGTCPQNASIRCLWAFILLTSYHCKAITDWGDTVQVTTNYLRKTRSNLDPTLDQDSCGMVALSLLACVALKENLANLLWLRNLSFSFVNHITELRTTNLDQIRRAA